MTQEVVSREAVRGIAIRRGLVFGLAIGALTVLSVAAARLVSIAELGTGATFLQGTARYTTLALILLPSATNLTTFILLFMTGYSTHARVRRIGAGALAGLVAGGLGGVVNLLAVSVNLALSLATVPLASGASAVRLPPSALTATVTSIALGLVWGVVAGAGLGALGALARQSIYS